MKKYTPMIMSAPKDNNYDAVKYSKSGKGLRLRKVKPYNKYSDDDKAIAVAMCLTFNNSSTDKIANTLGVSSRRLYAWTHGQDIKEEALIMADEYRQRIKDKFESILDLTLDTLPEKIDKASFWDLARTSSMAFDKIQLLDGKPTAIEGTTYPTEERSKRIYELMQEAKNRQNQLPIIEGYIVEES